VSDYSTERHRLGINMYMCVFACVRVGRGRGNADLPSNAGVVSTRTISSHYHHRHHNPTMTAFACNRIAWHVIHPVLRCVNGPRATMRLRRREAAGMVDVPALSPPQTNLPVRSPALPFFLDPSSQKETRGKVKRETVVVRTLSQHAPRQPSNCLDWG